MLSTGAAAVCSLLLVGCFTHLTQADGLGQYAGQCLVGEPPLYDPEQAGNVPTFIVNLDEAPETRWNHIVVKYVTQIQAALDTVKKMVGVVENGILYDVLVHFMTGAVDSIQEPYRTELYAIANATGISVGEFTLMNLFYEVSKGCTSIVAQDANGVLYHARNQDFGTFFIWDTVAHQWEQTETLRNLLINVNFIQNGRPLFFGVTFAGHLGVLTGLRQHAFTLSTNARFGSTLPTLIPWLLEGGNARHFLMYTDRDVMQNAKNFQEAKDYLSTVPLFGSAYFILGGTQPGEGVIITRGPNSTDHVASMNASDPNGWYVLQTNYDWDKDPLFLDDRRTPGNMCMQALTQANVDHSGLYQV
uniref:Acid ceramidase n=1 Tax=Plectus sambesii TaxID=2011161 RepID=A0A914VWR2_9BILA